MRTYSLTNPPQVGGSDLIPLQSALKTAKFYHGSVDGIFGFSTARACKEAKYRLGYPTSTVNLTGGEKLFNFLKGNKPLPAAYRIRRHARGYGLNANELMRVRIIAFALWGCKNNPAIHYQQSRPINYNTNNHLPWYIDCSGFVTSCYKAAGAPDPNGENYNGLGYTGTLLEHGVYIALADAKPGDLAIWGSYPGHHTALISDTTNKNDPLIISMGNEQQPAQYHISSEDSAQGMKPVIKRYIGV